MKKILALAFVCLCYFSSSAEIEYRHIDNIGATNIVLTDKESPENVVVSDAVLVNNGKKYSAKDISCDIKDGVATYKLKFSRLTVFKDCKVILTVNGKKVTVDLQKAMTDR